MLYSLILRHISKEFGTEDRETYANTDCFKTVDKTAVDLSLEYAYDAESPTITKVIVKNNNTGSLSEYKDGVLWKQ